MPWLETSPVEQRERFIADDQRGLYTRAELRNGRRSSIAAPAASVQLRATVDGGRGHLPVTADSTVCQQVVSRN